MIERTALKLLLAVTFILVTTGSAFAQTADEVIEKHLAALGGRAALGKITSRHTVGTVAVGTPMGELTGPFEGFYKTPNKSRVSMRIDATAFGGGEMLIEQRFDGTNGLSLNSVQGDTEITGNALDNFRNGAFPTNLLKYKDAGIKAELLPREKLGDKDMIAVRMTPKTGSPVKILLDPDTFLIARTVTTVNSPQMGGDIEQTVEPSDYRVVDGVKVAFQIVNSTPVQSIRVRLTKVEHNVPLDDAMFGKK